LSLGLNGTTRANDGQELLTSTLDIFVCASDIIQQVYYFWLLYEMSRFNYREGRPELNLGTHFRREIIFKYQIHVNVISNFHGKQSIVYTLTKS